MANEYDVQYRNCAGWFSDSVHTSLSEAKRKAKEIGRDYGPVFTATPVRIRVRSVSKWKTLEWKVKNEKRKGRE